MNLGLEGKAFVVGGGEQGARAGGRATTLVAEGARVLLRLAGRRGARAGSQELGAARAPVHGRSRRPGGRRRASSAARRRWSAGSTACWSTPAARRPATSRPDRRAVARGAYQLLFGGPIRLLREPFARSSPRTAASILFVTSSSVRAADPAARHVERAPPRRGGARRSAWRVELAPAIRVNCIAPGRFDTDRVRSLDESARRGSRDLDRGAARAQRRRRSRSAATASRPSSAASPPSCSRPPPRTSPARRSRSTAAP